MNRIAIIILHFGKINDTLFCLQSIKKIKTEHFFSVFVVENGSHTLTEKELHTILPQAKLLVLKKNKGFAGGNNFAIKKVLDMRYDFVLLLNNDTTISPNIIDELMVPFRDKFVGIVGPVITYMEKPHIMWFAGGKMYKQFCLTRHTNMNREVFSISNRRCDFITGAAMMVRSDVFKKIGYLSEDYFLYTEDVDFCFRAEKAGYHSLLIGKPLVKHNVSATNGLRGTNKLTKTKAFYFARNPFLFMKKNHLPIFTGVIGQCIALPYYIIQTENLSAGISYLKGFLEGIKYLF